MNIILAGMPLSGKTTVSVELGKLYGLDVIDTDAIIVNRHGDINKIFERYGEEYFRNLETEVVKEVSALENSVISTGGGCLLRQENVDIFKKNGKIVFLQTRLETLTERAKGDTSRPLLKGNTAQRLEKLYIERQPKYLAAADITLPADGLTPKQIARKIWEMTR